MKTYRTRQKDGNHETALREWTKAMKRTGLIVLLVLTCMILGFGGREVQEGMRNEGPKGEVSKKTETPAKAGRAKQVSDTDAEMKGMSMESIQKRGDIRERRAGRNQIVPERQEERIGVKFMAVDIKPREKVIRTVGRVDYDDKRIITVAPKIAGKIEDLYVGSLGGYVRQGEPLLSIYSAEMVAAQEEYLLALRAKDEFSKSPFQEVARSGESLAASAKRRLKLFHMSDEEIGTLEETRQARKTINVCAPENGYFVEKQAYKGMNVTPDTLFKLADLSVVRVVSDIDEYDLPFVQLGQHAAIRLEAIPGETFTGKAVYVSPSNRETHTAKVKFEISNPKAELKPEMRADVEIKAKLNQKPTIPDGIISASPSFREPEARDALVDSNHQTAYDIFIAQLSKKYKVDFHLIKAIIQTESGFNPYAVSSKGARGLMQLMPETAQRMNVSNLFDPKENIEGGIRYLKYLVSLFDDDLELSLAAYNAGEKVVSQFRGIPPYPETADYVKKVMALYHAYKS